MIYRDAGDDDAAAATATAAAETKSGDILLHKNSPDIVSGSIRSTKILMHFTVEFELHLRTDTLDRRLSMPSTPPLRMYRIFVSLFSSSVVFQKTIH